MDKGKRPGALWSLLTGGGDGGGGGGGGYNFEWADVTEITIGANSVANTQAANEYFSSYAYDVIIFSGDFSINHQIALCSSNQGNGTMNNVFRYASGKIRATSVGTNFDCVLVEGSKYLLMKIKT